MAKSNSDSNGLRQDQPECAGDVPGRPERNSGWRVSVDHDRGRPDFTKPSGLTSDPIYTADRRGGILITFGPQCNRRRVLNPSKGDPSRRAPAHRTYPMPHPRGRPRRARPRPAIERARHGCAGHRTHTTRIAGPYLRASNRSEPVDIEYISGAGRPGHLIFASVRMTGCNKSPSNRPLRVTVLHAMCFTHRLRPSTDNGQTIPDREIPGCQSERHGPARTDQRPGGSCGDVARSEADPSSRVRTPGRVG